ncbi:hypothetical protein C3L33_03517, partial [Rhododendron williamsianum]
MESGLSGRRGGRTLQHQFDAVRVVSQAPERDSRVSCWSQFRGIYKYTLLKNTVILGYMILVQFYNAPSNEYQAKLVLKPLSCDRNWKFMYEPLRHEVRVLSKKIPVTKFLNLQVGVCHNYQLHAIGWKWKLTTCFGGDGVSRIRNKTSLGLCPGVDFRFCWRADYVLPEITGQVLDPSSVAFTRKEMSKEKNPLPLAVGTGEPLFNMNSGRLQASLDRIETILNHTTS